MVVDANSLKITVARQDHLPKKVLHQIRQSLPLIRAGQEAQQWMVLVSGPAILQDQRHICAGLRNKLHTPKTHRIARKPIAYQA